MSETLLVSHGHLTGLGYHGTLLNDPLRMDAYDRAIRALVRPGVRVLDLGCGTGVLSMLAARRGAHVVAVESMPVAAVARRLLEANRLADRITLHHAPLSAVPPEPVDLVLSEFMGRFVDDDGMLPAVSAARRWLAPGGTFCPGTLTRWLAPVRDTQLPETRRFAEPLLGLHLAAALPAVRSSRYSVHLGRDTLLAEPLVYDRFAPPDLPPTASAPACFRIDRAGTLDGLIGWFEAALAPGVVLQTGPGHDTHWGQMLFPLPPVAALPGDLLEVHTRPEARRWRWSGRLLRDGAPIYTFDQQSLAEPPPVPSTLPRWPALPPPAPAPTVLGEDDRGARIQAINQQAVAAYQQGDPATAARLLAGVCADLRPDEDPLAPALYENLGIFQLARGHSRAAAQCFLRAIDGGTTQQQSMRLVIDAFARIGQPHNAARALAAYEAAFGAHPQGWTAWDVAPCCGNQRASA